MRSASFRPLAALAFGLLTAASWAQFTPGNLVVLSATNPGIGFGTIGDGRHGWVLRELNTFGTFTGFSSTLYAGTSGAAAAEVVPFSGSPFASWTEGPYLHRSSDRRFLTTFGYGFRVASGGIAAVAVSATAPRTIARIDSAGAVNFTNLTSGAAGTVRQAFTTDGSHFWATTSGVNMAYAPVGASSLTQVAAGFSSYGIQESGGEIYFGGSNIWRVPGQPSAAATPLSVFSTGGLNWAMAFVVVSPTTVYFADADPATTSIGRFDLIGGVWTRTLSFSPTTGSSIGVRSLIYDPDFQTFYALTGEGVVNGTSAAVGQRIISFPLSLTAPPITTLATSTTEVWKGLAFTPEPAQGSHAGVYGVAGAADTMAANVVRVLYEDATVSPKTFRVGGINTTTGQHRSMALTTPISLPNANCSLVASVRGADFPMRYLFWDPIARNLYVSLNNVAGTTVTSAPIPVAAGFTPIKMAVANNGRSYILMVGRSVNGNVARVQEINADHDISNAIPPTAGNLFDSGGTSYAVAGYFATDILATNDSIEILWAGKTGAAAPGTGGAILGTIALPAEVMANSANRSIPNDPVGGTLMPFAFDVDRTVGTGRYYLLSLGEGHLFRADRIALDWSSVTDSGASYRRTPVTPAVPTGTSGIYRARAVDIVWDALASEARIVVLGTNSGSTVPTLTQNAAGSVRLWSFTTTLGLIRSTLRMVPGVAPLP